MDKDKIKLNASGESDERNARQKKNQWKGNTRRWIFNLVLFSAVPSIFNAICWSSSVSFCINFAAVGAGRRRGRWPASIALLSFCSSWIMSRPCWKKSDEKVIHFRLQWFDNFQTWIIMLFPKWKWWKVSILLQFRKFLCQTRQRLASGPKMMVSNPTVMISFWENCILADDKLKWASSERFYEWLTVAAPVSACRCLYLHIYILN